MEKHARLERALGPGTAILLVISSMIGSGIFKKIAPMSATLGDGRLVLLAWVLAGLVSMFGVFTYSGLAKLTIEGGGQFEYFRIIYGDFFAFIFGWSCFTVIQSASIASIAYVFSQSVNNIFPVGNIAGPLVSWSVFGWHVFSDSGVKLITILTIVLLTAINYFGVKKGGALNNIFSISKILGILFLITAAFLLSGHREGDLGNTVEVPHALPFLPAMFAAMLAAFWAYDGWINITYIGGELKNPKRNIPLSIITGTAFVMLIYFLVNFAYLRVLPLQHFLDINNSQDTIAAAEVAQAMMGRTGFLLLSVLILLCTFGATNATLMSSPRIYHRMAEKGLFFKSFGAVHPAYHTPYKSLLLQMAWSSVLVLTGTFDQLTNMLIFASFIFYGSGALGLLIMKRRGVIRARVFGYPWIPVLYALFCAGLVLNTLLTDFRESAWGLLLMCTGIPLYFYFRNIQTLPRKSS